jgi:phage gp37-like protein
VVLVVGLFATLFVRWDQQLRSEARAVSRWTRHVQQVVMVGGKRRRSQAHAVDIKQQEQI